MFSGGGAMFGGDGMFEAMRRVATQGGVAPRLTLEKSYFAARRFAARSRSRSGARRRWRA